MVPWITGLVMVVAGVIIIGWDIYLATDRIRGNTWSEVLRDWGRHAPIIPWTLGVLLGHWFHPFEFYENILPLAVLSVTVGISGVARKFPGWALSLFAVGGVIAGALFLEGAMRIHNYQPVCPWCTFIDREHWADEADAVAHTTPHIMTCPKCKKDYMYEYCCYFSVRKMTEEERSEWE